ncbi:uncharacterized protein LOC123874725 isoform X2 [Maniola jurtina]|uniref:uncharacterized protein LOC123874725 isoform X2 n=1 Tax=Maniola jurtina TaxID=191418 RepID=UPI001E68A511|nr:uncharacterized protein LOC123874725 isoform X2 [Maniola jurtina]
MIDESVIISVRTWTRSVEKIGKVGYSDGVTDGQNTSFQSSFDMGYCQGLKFGLDLGYKLAFEQQLYNFQSDKQRPTDPRRINCQICLDQTIKLENVVNLFNRQKEKNDEYLIKM